MAAKHPRAARRPGRADRGMRRSSELVSGRLVLWAMFCVLAYGLGVGLIVTGVLNHAGIIQIVIGIVLTVGGGAGVYVRRRELRPARSADGGGHKLER
jgi:hypothetical protein